LIEKEKGIAAKLQFMDACFVHQHAISNRALTNHKKEEIKQAFAKIAQQAGLVDRGSADKKLTFDPFVARMDDWENLMKPTFAEHKIALSYQVRCIWDAETCDTWKACSRHG
jgi:Ca2+-binding EF-hand superfamily protein